MGSERRKKVLLAGMSVLATLLAAEAALRILGIGAAGRGSPWFAGGNHPRFLFQPDPVSGYTLRPGFRGREIAPGNEFDVEAAVDDRGLRDYAHVSGFRPAVLALGDSMTFGEGVPADRTWSAVLERQVGVRVYNGGVPGYSTCQIAGRADRLIPTLRPDLVLVALSPHWDRQRCANPFFYLDGYIVSRSYLERLYLIDGNLYLSEVRWPIFGPATAYAKRYSHLARLALPPLGNAVRAASSRPESPSPAAPGDFEPTARALASIRERARKSGAGFLAILIDSRGPEHASDRDILEGILRERELPYLSLDALLARADWPRLRYPRDQHWNEEGHRTVGTALAPEVRSRLGRRLPGSL